MPSNTALRLSVPMEDAEHGASFKTSRRPRSVCPFIKWRPPLHTANAACCREARNPLAVSAVGWPV